MSSSKLQLHAQFELDEQGRPRFVVANGRKHYKISISVPEPPEKAASVTYRLHPTYWDPVREVPRAGSKPDFREEITSYGDFDLSASVSGSLETPAVKVPLSKLLSGAHRSDEGDAEAIAAALEDIRNN